MEFDDLSKKVIGCAIEVHRELGPGLLESTYEHCFARELALNEIEFERQKALPVTYKGIKLDCGYRIDLLINRQIVVELKSVRALTPVDEAQILTYMKLSDIRIGLLINFNVALLKQGLKRFVL